MKGSFLTHAILACAIGLGPSEGIAQEPLVQNVRLTFHIIEADGFAETDPAIADIVAELRDVFRFSGYRHLDTSVLSATLAGDMRDADGSVFTIVRQRAALREHGTFEIEAWVYQTREPTAVRVSVRLNHEDSAYLSSSGQRLMPAVIDASVTARSGQTVVLGSGRPDTSGGALILAMTVQLGERN